MKYFKQVWNLIKQEKLFSSIYIIGTGLSITMIMVLSIVYYLRIANIYPETHRDRMLILKAGMEEGKGNDAFVNIGDFSYPFIETCLIPLKSAEAVTAVRGGYDNYVQILETKQQLPVTLKYVDTSFWTVFPFRFVAGTPFSEADMQSGIRSAVISESLAKKLFGQTSAEGKYVNLDFDQYRISGVVKNASFVTERTFADIWVPYTVLPDYKSSWSPIKALGDFQAYILAPSTNELDVVKEEIIENLHRFNSENKEGTLTIFSQPDRQWQSIFRMHTSTDINFKTIIWQYSLIFFVLLFIPAVSLSGMTESRMERRLSEMGIRRTFGAPVSTLMNQIISENFFFTLLGGLFGLLFSYFLIFLTRNWILQIVGGGFSDILSEGGQVVLSPSMLFNVPIFLIALLVCFVLNLLSALVPAWRASHRQIIYSLNEK